MEDNYWKRTWDLRRSRRGFLVGAGAVGAGGAGLALVGCGSSSDKTNTPAATKPAGSSTAAPGGKTATGSSTAAGPSPKSGGTFQNVTTGDPPTLHPYKNLSFTVKGFACYVYSRLMKYDTQPGKDPALITPTGDLAEKIESSPDGTQWTVTLRDNITFQDIAPVSGRALDIDDIKYSWAQMTGPTSQNANQVAFVDHLEYPDAKTVKFFLKTPNAAFKDVLADCNLFWIIPKEADSSLDISKTPVGTGPWQMTNYTPSSSFSFAKNPKWYDAPRPYIDKIELAIIPTAATRIAQYVAGNLDATDLTSLDLANVKSGRAGTQFSSITPQLMSFFYFDHVSQAQQPWQKDPRVRQAISECIDRDALNELLFDITKVKAQGFDITVNWNNLIPSGMKRWWLDPKSSAEGETSKFFKYDPKDAKALLEAAGASDMSIKFQYPATIYGAVFDSCAQANIQYMNAVGIKTTTDVQNYQSQYITQTFSGNFSGVAFGYETPFPEGGSYPIRFFTDNPLNHEQVKDAELAQLAQQQQQELDPAKRKQLFYEIQQKNAEKMYYIPNQAGAGPAWTAYSPRLQQATQIQTIGYGAPTEDYTKWWIDPSKA